MSTINSANRKVASVVLFADSNYRPKHNEGALWDSVRKALLFVDITGKKVITFDPKRHHTQFFDLPEHVGTVVPTKSGEFLVALQSGIGIIDPDTEIFTWKLKFNSDHALRSNDGKCSPEGRFWFGTMGYDPDAQQNEGSLYRLNNDFSLTTVLDRSVTISNGILWNKAGDIMYYIDTPTNMVVAYDYDQTTGSISNKKTVIEAGEVPGYFDGATIDSDDKIWIALWGGGGVGRYDPLTGKLLYFVEAHDAKQVSSCAFGGPNLSTLYITTSREGLSPDDLAKQKMAGAVFEVDLLYSGLPAYTFG